MTSALRLARRRRGIALESMHDGIEGSHDSVPAHVHGG